MGMISLLWVFLVVLGHTTISHLKFQRLHYTGDDVVFAGMASDITLFTQANTIESYRTKFPVIFYFHYTFDVSKGQASVFS